MAYWWYQAIAWTSVDLSSTMSCDIHRMALLWKDIANYKIEYFCSKPHPDFPGTNELTRASSGSSLPPRIIAQRFKEHGTALTVGRENGTGYWKWHRHARGNLILFAYHDIDLDLPYNVHDYIYVCGDMFTLSGDDILDWTLLVISTYLVC